MISRIGVYALLWMHAVNGYISKEEVNAMAQQHDQINAENGMMNS
jgi:hypothetical protein